jgi:lipid A 3-O-deacylase
MRYKTSFFATAAAVSLLAGAGPAHAEGLIDEVRVGLFDHDTSAVGNSKEPGADVVLEAVSHPIPWLKLIGHPRVVVGTALNTAGSTNQIYAGLDAQLNVFKGIASDHDAIFIGGTVGATLHDGKIDVRGTPEEAEWKSHGSSVLWRTGFDVGYRFNETWSVALSFNHISNADYTNPNEGSNDLGIIVGKKL